jgi:large subunit ribosomal protein L22
MAYHASHRFARIAPRKARLVADMIRGKRIEEALTALDFSKKRGSVFISTVLKSAIASESRVDEGPTLDRFQPKDRGRAHPIKKRTSHIHIAVEER